MYILYAVVNFDALASDIRIGWSQVVFLWLMQDSNRGYHQIASRLNARRQTDWAIEYQAKNLNSTAHPYDQRAFSPHDPTASWLSHLTLEIYMFVVNFDALAQASDFRSERRHVVFLCWMQDSNPGYLEPIALSRIKLTRHPVPMFSEHSAYSTPLTLGNPFPYPGINITRPFCYLRVKSLFRLI